MIEIRQPLCFSEIGRKDNQEDYLYPPKADTHTRVFILCDGMGGHDNGEVASKTAATALGTFLSARHPVTLADFDTALAKAYDALDGIDTDSARKPGTTMTCLCLNDNSFLVAHIGDSRIYHLRPSLFDPRTKRGGILYQSSDHSLVNDLLKAGELTEEEARVFPQRNVITRAMQPHLDKRYAADVYEFTDVRPGDYFFLCCDGILEQLSNTSLCEILAMTSLDDKQKLNVIKSICDGNTRDNYSCWLIPVKDAVIMQTASNPNVIRANAIQQPSSVTHAKSPSERRPESPATGNPPASAKRRSFMRPPRPALKELNWRKLAIIVATIIILTVVAYFAYTLFFRPAPRAVIPTRHHTELPAHGGGQRTMGVTPRSW